MSTLIAVMSLVINLAVFALMRYQVRQDLGQRRKQATLEFTTASSARSQEFATIPALRRD